MCDFPTVIENFTSLVTSISVGIIFSSSVPHPPCSLFSEPRTVRSWWNTSGIVDYLRYYETFLLASAKVDELRTVRDYRSPPFPHPFSRQWHRSVVHVRCNAGSFFFFFVFVFARRLPPAAGCSRKRGGLRHENGLSTSSSSRAGDGNRRSDRWVSISRRILKGDRARRGASRQRQDEPGDVAGSGAVRRAAGEEEGAPREQLFLLLRSSARRCPPLQPSQLQRATWWVPRATFRRLFAIRTSLYTVSHEITDASKFCRLNRRVASPHDFTCLTVRSSDIQFISMKNRILLWKSMEQKYNLGPGNSFGFADNC